MRRGRAVGIGVAVLLGLSACDGEGTIGAPQGPGVIRSATTVPPADGADDGTATPDGADGTATTIGAETTTTLPPDPMPPTAQFADVALDTELVADVEIATAVAWRRDDPKMYVTTQDGWIYAYENGTRTTVYDMTAEVSEYAFGSERGLLGIAFDPRDGRMFLNYTDVDLDTHVISFELADGVVVPESRREYLYIEQPGLGHNGGRLLFDDEGHLYIASGDGGGSNGRDAQDTTKLFGAILRIIPSLDGPSYDIPPDNPFADGVADRPEVWARGFRNPWTFSIDEPTGDMWIGDVGNDEIEEIDVIRAGQKGLNFGWYYFEGNNQRVFDNVPAGLTPPIHTWTRAEGIAAMGGYVYRGDAIPELRGVYLFGDLTGPIWGMGADGVTRLDIEFSNLVGWAQGPDRELYLISGRNGVFKLVPG